MMLGIQFLVWDRLIMWELGRCLSKFTLYLETFEKQEVLFKMCDPVLKLEPLVKMYSPAAES